MHRTYVRRRVVLGLVSVAFLACALVPVGRALGADGIRPTGRRTYVVRDGDTLWGIATRLAPGGDPRPTVAAIERANRVDPGALTPGRTLVVPTDG